MSSSESVSSSFQSIDMKSNYRPESASTNQTLGFNQQESFVRPQISSQQQQTISYFNHESNIEHQYSTCCTYCQSDNCICSKKADEDQMFNFDFNYQTNNSSSANIMIDSNCNPCTSNAKGSNSHMMLEYNSNTTSTTNTNNNNNNNYELRLDQQHTETSHQNSHSTYDETQTHLFTSDCNHHAATLPDLNDRILIQDRNVYGYNSDASPTEWQLNRQMQIDELKFEHNNLDSYYDSRSHYNNHIKPNQDPNNNSNSNNNTSNQLQTQPNTSSQEAYIEKRTTVVNQDSQPPAQYYTQCYTYHPNQVYQDSNYQNYIQTDNNVSFCDTSINVQQDSYRSSIHQDGKTPVSNQMIYHQHHHQQHDTNQSKLESQSSYQIQYHAPDSNEYEQQQLQFNQAENKSAVYTSLQQLASSCDKSSNQVTTTTAFKEVDSSSQQAAKMRLLKGRRGRPRKKGLRSKNKVNGKLWEFIRDLLLNERTNPSFIRWERREDGVFKFVQSDKVAKMWGERKQNPKMTYEKLSRAMRYYYKSKVLLPVFGRRLVYKFGPNATGWLPTDICTISMDDDKSGIIQ